jgi:hypothetical protein
MFVLGVLLMVSVPLIGLGIGFCRIGHSPCEWPEEM